MADNNAGYGHLASRRTAGGMGGAWGDLDRVLRGAGRRPDRIRALADRLCFAPYIKDYDAIAGNRPADCAERFASLCRTLISAYRGGERIGGAVIVVDSPTARLIDGESDVAVLWDLRVRQTSRGTGVGGALFKAAENWATARGCRQLKVETQDINVPACRLYAKEGCRLESVEHGAYRELPSEVRLIWTKSLGCGFSARS